MAVSTINRVLPPSPSWHIVVNGNLLGDHYYMILLSDASINNEFFIVPYNPSDNAGGSVFSSVLNNGTSMYLCTGKFAYSNGTVSITNAKRAEPSAPSQQQTWYVSIRLIWEIG